MAFAEQKIKLVPNIATPAPALSEGLNLTLSATWIGTIASPDESK